jgi:hypothetical protein
MKTTFAGLMIVTADAIANANQGQQPVTNKQIAEAVLASGLMKSKGEILFIENGSVRKETTFDSILVVIKGSSATENLVNQAFEKEIEMIPWVENYKKFYSLETTLDFLSHLALQLGYGREFIAGLKTNTIFFEGGIEKEMAWTDLVALLVNTVPFVAVDDDTEKFVHGLTQKMVFGEGVTVASVKDTTFGVVIFDEKFLPSITEAKRLAVATNVCIVTGTREDNSRTAIILPGNEHLAERFAEKTGLGTEIIDGVTIFIDPTGDVTEGLVEYLSDTIGFLKGNAIQYTEVTTPVWVRTLMGETVVEATTKRVPAGATA